MAVHVTCPQCATVNAMPAAGSGPCAGCGTHLSVRRQRLPQRASVPAVPAPAGTFGSLLAVQDEPIAPDAPWIDDVHHDQATMVHPDAYRTQGETSDALHQAQTQVFAPDYDALDSSFAHGQPGQDQGEHAEAHLDVSRAPTAVHPSAAMSQPPTEDVSADDPFSNVDDAADFHVGDATRPMQGLPASLAQHLEDEASLGTDLGQIPDLSAEAPPSFLGSDDGPAPHGGEPAPPPVSDETIDALFAGADEAPADTQDNALADLDVAPVPPALDFDDARTPSDGTDALSSVPAPIDDFVPRPPATQSGHVPVGGDDPSDSSSWLADAEAADAALQGALDAMFTQSGHALAAPGAPAGGAVSLADLEQHADGGVPVGDAGLLAQLDAMPPAQSPEQAPQALPAPIPELPPRQAVSNLAATPVAPDAAVTAAGIKPAQIVRHLEIGGGLRGDAGETVLFDVFSDVVLVARDSSLVSFRRYAFDKRSLELDIGPNPHTLALTLADGRSCTLRLGPDDEAVAAAIVNAHGGRTTRSAPKPHTESHAAPHAGPSASPLAAERTDQLPARAQLADAAPTEQVQRVRPASSRPHTERKAQPTERKAEGARATREGPSVFRLAAPFAAAGVLLGLGLGVLLQPSPHEGMSPARIKARQAYAAGNQFYAQSRFDEAAASYREALAHDESYVQIHRALGAALSQAKHPKEAREAYQAYLDRAPGAGDRAVVQKVLSRYADKVKSKQAKDAP